jgi:DNA polymerase-3 subunit epsilon
MQILFYDAETTGLPVWKEPSEGENQPHIVQLAACLVDAETRDVLKSFDLIVQPSGWVIPDDMAKIHGITTERAIEVGVPEAEVLAEFLTLHELCQQRVAFNEQFDQRIIRIALKRYGHTDEFADAFKALPAECAMKLAHKALGGGKFPKLSEAHQALIGEPHEGAHSAMGDVKACMRVYWATKDRQAAAA